MPLRLDETSGSLLLAAALCAACGCEHNEPRGGPATAAPVRHPEPAVPPQVESPPAGARARCVVPLPPDAPAPARRAVTCPKDPTGPPSLPRGWVTFPDAPRAPRLAIEIADTNPSRERGLMYRTSMPEDQGMIFSWADEAERSFWMHDTCIPLDMLYVGGDGVIEGVLEEVPPMDDTPRGVPCPVAHVLEVNAGWTRAHGIVPGQHLAIEK